MKLVVNVLLLLVCLQVAAAAPNDVYSFSLYVNNDTDGNCLAAADQLGQQVLDTFDDATGFTPYEDELRSRSLRALGTRICSRTYCSKPANYQYCIFVGCACSCGRGRELQSSDASDNAKIVHATKLVEDMLVTRGAELGCELELDMDKVRG